MNDQLLPYAAAAITTLAGIFGFFWARSGERNKVGGIGWSALALIVAGGLITVYQTHRQSERATAASARAEQLSEELRRTQFSTSAAVLTLVNGFDLSQRVGSIVFYVSVPNVEGRPVLPPGFVGPFPALPAGARANFRLWLSGALDQSYDLAPTPRGGIRLTDNGQRLPAFELERNGNNVAFRSLAPVAEDAPEGIWSAGVDLSGPSDEIGLPETLGPTGPDVEDPGEYSFSITFVSTAQLRRLISQLVRQRYYGLFALEILGAGEAEIERMTQGFAQMSPTLVFSVPTRSGAAGGENDCAASYIRVPMRLRRISQPEARLIVFALESESRGFRAEVCEGGP